MILDTHIWIRWQSEPEGLPDWVRREIASAQSLAISAISCWELGQLVLRKRVLLKMTLADWIDEATGRSVACLPIGREIAQLAAQLPEHHRDPADRLIIATAIACNAGLLSLDTVFPAYVEHGLQLIKP
jgi:PIN domain nuclease of toxin-antitoxin system